MSSAKGWLWCARCGRAYHVSQQRYGVCACCGERQERCGYEDCNALGEFDALDWSEVRGLIKSLPKVPKRGVVYPLYDLGLTVFECGHGIGTGRAATVAAG